ncbi:hypothetical protein AGMMS49938_00770 [Fibrobacterales bacterium]|nr:hypothetical protein AGMMS49938_00770 [Fibrobacterales bacterium]
MLLYHGTTAEFKEVDLSIDNSYNEFGKGFYLSTDYDVAKHKATYLMKSPATDIPRIMTFEVDLSGLKIQNFNGEYVNKEWLEIVYSKNTADYDIIWGKVVDELGINNEYLSKYILARRKNESDVETIGEDLIELLKKESEDQVCIKTELALKNLKLLDIKLL